MGDPRLNSLHLDPTRRQEFRRARDAMLQSRGNETIYAERKRENDPEPGNTFIRNDQGTPPATLEFWLVDRDYIYPLKVGLNTLGRSSENDIVVEDLYVSRRHCGVMVHHDHSCVLHDTASKNGTFLNGVKIPGPTVLKAGDEIRICNRQFIFLTRAAQQAGEGQATGVLPQSGAPLSHTRTIAG